MEAGDCEAKANEFAEHLEKVFLEIAGGVRPEHYKEIAPTTSKHLRVTSCRNYVQDQISTQLRRRMKDCFEENNLVQNLKLLTEIRQNSGPVNYELSKYYESDPTIIRKDWLLKRRTMLTEKLAELQNQTRNVDDEIKMRRKLMAEQMRKMQEIENTTFRKILLLDKQ